MTENVDSAEKEIFKIVGKCKSIDYDDFYKLFCKGIFRIALIDMIDNIQQLNKNFTELPLSLKLGAYRRNLLLSGLDKQNSDLKVKG